MIMDIKILRTIMLAAAMAVSLALPLAIPLVIPLDAAGQEKRTPDARTLSSARPPEDLQAMAQEEERVMAEERMILTSSAFAEGETIPVRYTCDGEDLSPPLAWSSPPAETRSFALVCDDPDAPVGTWDHWIVFSLSGDMTSLPEGVTTKSDLGKSVRHGQNSWRRTGYGGPCPPPGEPHRYFFRLYALSEPVELPDKATKQELLQAMAPLILSTAELMGTYGR